MPMYYKDPSDVLDYQIDWSEWLGSDTIDLSDWSVPSGITIESDINTSTTATVWLSGGTVGWSYVVVNQIQTAGGRTKERSIVIQIVEQ